MSAAQVGPYREGAASTSAQSALAALATATTDVVYRMNADWSEMQPLDGRGLVPSSDVPVDEHWLDVNVPAFEHPRVRQAIAAAIADKGLFELEHRTLRPDGSLGWTYSRAVPILDDAGDIVEWMGLARDTTAEKTAQHALQASEQRFRAVFEQSTGGIAQVDLEGRFVLVNDRFCEIVQRSRDDLLARHVRDLVAPEDADELRSVFDGLASGATSSITIERRYVRPDGTRIWAQSAMSGVRGPDGRVAFVTAVVADITALREANDAQIDLAAQRQLALDAAGLGWWQYDPTTGIVAHDARYAEIYGLEGDGPRAIEAISALLHPDDAPMLWAAVEAAMDPVEPAPYSVEYRIVRPDGRIRWLEAHGVASFRDEGASRTVSNFVGTVADVTERRTAQEILREDEARFRKMADAVPQIIWITDAFGRVEFFNRQWSRYTGLGYVPATAAETAGTVVHPDDAGITMERFERARASGRPFIVEHRIRSASGDYRWFLVRAEPEHDPQSGEIVRWYGASVDIHDRRTAEQALAETDRRKDEFLATLAHELRNPLAPIRTGLALLGMGPSAEAAAHTREVMNRQLAHMVRLIDDLLDIARINSDKLELRTEPLDLRSVLDEAIEASRPAIDQARHRLFVSTPPRAMSVVGDRTRLVQVFGNLLSNAAKYTPAGGRIDVSADLEGASAVVRVRDSGVGIEGDALTGVFGLFSQVSSSLGRSQGGLGIGLALVERLVTLHGGDVVADSDGAGRGSVFTVRLPARDRGPDGDADGSRLPASPTSAPLDILVVDDNGDAAEMMSTLLQALGHTVRVAHDASEALAAIAARVPRLAFLDIGLPGMDGHELATRIRAGHSGAATTLVALTGWGSRADVDRALASGFDQHMTKPVDARRVAEVLSSVR
ncbi:PAS domain S-box protein [Lysobacter xanthus]